MKKQLLIGFGNKARNGKDSAANAIKEYFENDYDNGYAAPPVKVGIFKYATALYAEVNEGIKNGIWESRRIIPDNPKECHAILPDWVQPEPNPEISALAPYGKHPKLLQWWGTEYRRAQDENYWVKKTFAAIPANLDIAIITDVRFPNEAEGVISRGGYTVNVQRLREDGTQYYSSDRPATHPVRDSSRRPEVLELLFEDSRRPYSTARRVCNHVGSLSPRFGKEMSNINKITIISRSGDLNAIDYPVGERTNLREALKYLRQRGGYQLHENVFVPFEEVLYIREEIK
jgi:hypothetical protein